LPAVRPNEGPSTTIPGTDLTQDALANLHTPVIYILGGPPNWAETKTPNSLQN